MSTVTAAVKDVEEKFKQRWVFSHIKSWSRGINKVSIMLFYPNL